MREFAKSMVGFSWAVGLFGFQQMSKAMGTMVEPIDVTVAQLEDVARSAERHLSDHYVAQFKAGDQWQRRLIDVMFDAATLRNVDARSVASTLDPRPMMTDMDPRRVFDGGVDLMSRSFEVVRSAVPGSGPSVG